MQKISFVHIVRLLPAFFILALWGCASIGNPSGGPRDEDPPVFVSGNPAPGATNVDREKIVLAFNEIVNVKDAFEKVVVSPTSKAVPKVSSAGRRVTVSFDSLQPNTTYTIDFANAIEDNNEGNKLEGFAYTFSTGPDLDTLRISGMVLGARDLEPQQGILVGVYENLNDTAFTGERMLRVAKTDDRGRFTVRGLKPVEYRVFALADNDRDYKYSSPEEDIAFLDYTVVPYSEPVIVSDTTYTPLGKVDTIKSRMRTRFLPNDILLRTFNSLKRPQYLSRNERIDSTRVFLKFNAPSDQFPELRVIGHPEITELGVLESSLKRDSLVYWLSPELVNTDSLMIAATYLRTDSAKQLTLATDTLKFFTSRPKVKPNKKKNQEKIISPEDSINMITMGLKSLSINTLDIYEPLRLQFDRPLSLLDTSAFRLETLVDTVWRRVPGKWGLSQRDSLSPRDFVVDYDWNFGTKYRIIADSLAAVGIDGKPTRPFSHNFETKKEEDYGQISFSLSGLDPEIPAFVELVTQSDQLLRSLPVRDGRVTFPYLDPGRYYARVIEDYNGNGIYDTGSYEDLQQPELAYYYPKPINIKKNWVKEEPWDVFAIAIDIMKPETVKKNRPEVKKVDRLNSKGDDYDDEEEEENFDPTRNPFDPNSRNRRKTGSY